MHFIIYTIIQSYWLLAQDQSESMRTLAASVRPMSCREPINQSQFCLINTIQGYVHTAMLKCGQNLIILPQ